MSDSTAVALAASIIAAVAAVIGLLVAWIKFSRDT